MKSKGEIIIGLHEMEKDGDLKSCLIKFKMSENSQAKSRYIRVFYPSWYDGTAMNAIYDKTTDEADG